MNIPNKIKNLLWMQGIFTIVSVYINIFVNLYVWESSQSLRDVAWLNLWLFVSIFFTYYIGTKLIERGYPTRVLSQFASVLAILSFINLSFLRIEPMELWIILIALPIGFTFGFYYCGMNVNLSLLGKDKEIQHFFAYSAVQNQFISFLLPFLAAFVIQSYGYIPSFIMMLLFSILMFYYSFKTPILKLEKTEPVQLGQIFKKKHLKWIFPSNAAMIFLLQFQGIFAMVFTFTITENKWYIALLNVLYTICLYLAMLLLKRAVNIKENVWIYGGILFITIGFIFALMGTNLFFILSNIMTMIGVFYFNSVLLGRHFNVIREESPRVQATLFLIREATLSISRGFLLALVLLVDELKGPVFITLLIISIIAGLFTPYFQHKFEQR
jgi:YQGE family putative transporter